jgi:hypothetical protein
VAGAAAPVFELGSPEASRHTSGFSELVKETFRPVEEVKATFGASSSEGDTAFIEDAPSDPNNSRQGAGQTAVPSAMPLSMPPPHSAPLNGFNLSESGGGTAAATGQAVFGGVNPGTAPTINLSDIVAAHAEASPAAPAFAPVAPLAVGAPAMNVPPMAGTPSSESDQAPFPLGSQAAELPQTAVPAFARREAAMPPPAYSSFSLTAAEAAPIAHRKKTPTALLAGLAVLLVGGAAYVMFTDEISALLGLSTEEAVQPADGQVATGQPAAPVAGNAGKNPGGASAAQKPNGPGKAGTMTAPAAPAVVTVPLKSFLASKNNRYFSTVNAAFERGEPSEAIRAFRSPLQTPLSKEDKIIAAEMEARYYLLVGKAEKAVSVLEPHCATPVATSYGSCVHYVRALISTRQFAHAKKILEWVRQSPGLEAFKEQQTVMELGLRALSVPMVDMSRALFTQIVSEFNVPFEWHRQRVAWFARAFLGLQKKNREALLTTLLVSRRESTVNSIRLLEKSSIGVNEGLLVNFLNYWASRFELKPFSDLVGRSSLDSDYARLGKLYLFMSRAFKENYQSIATALVGYVGRPSYEEIARLLTANMAINDGNVSKAWEIFRRDFENVRSRKVRFGYEWALVFARCAVNEKGTRNLILAERELEAHESRGVAIQGDFFHWLLKARIERETQTHGGSSFDQAKKLAYGPFENGLLVVEEARRLRAAGKVKEAAMLLHNSVSSIPDHGVLLQTAAEITPLVGLSPQRYLEGFSSIPEERLMRSMEYPMLSDETMRVLLESI